MVEAPIATVERLVSDIPAIRLEICSIKLCPAISMPKTCFIWLSAMINALAVINPDITGWLRKLARNPKRAKPIAIRIRPEMSASTIAAPRYSGVPRAINSPIAEAVIRDVTATGPTASVIEVPKIV